MTPIILHLSNDYPDPVQPRKTRAVQSLVEGTPKYRHIVYSLNRANAVAGLCAIPFGDDRVAVSYGALPKGIFWAQRLRAVAQWIKDDLYTKGIKPDVIEAHKFTIEGVIGLELSKEFLCPLVCDIQGYTDVNMLLRKPDFLGVYKEISQMASAIFPYAPWPLPMFYQKLGLSQEKCHSLPVIPTIDIMKAAPCIQEERLLSVFHLDGWKNKNFYGMVMAIKLLKENGRRVFLDIYGSGSPKTMLLLSNIIKKSGLSDCVTLKGPVENGKIPDVMQKYCGFVMPSHSESYGLVYVEALFSGVPILLNAKRGISGYFDLSQVGYGCDPASVEDIARGMVILLDRQKDLKEGIAQMQKRGVFDFMRRHMILKTYMDVMDSVLAGKK